MLTAAGLGAIRFIYSNVYDALYHDYAASKQHAEYQRQFEEKCSKLPTVESVVRCFIEQSKTSREAQRAEEDLYAQKQMADWAWWMVVVSVAIGAPTVALTILGVRFVIGTYKEAVKSTKAAEEAVAITRHASESELRAYVYVETAKRVQTVTPDDKKRWEIFVQFKNYGQTPAYNVTISLNHLIAESVNVPDWDRLTLHPAVYLPPSDTSTTSVDLSELKDTWARFKYGQVTVYFWGRIHYIDAFGEPRWASFRMENTFRDEGQFGYCSRGNEADN